MANEFPVANQHVDAVGVPIVVGNTAKIKHKFSGIGDFALACFRARNGDITPAMKHWEKTCKVLKAL